MAPFDLHSLCLFFAIFSLLGGLAAALYFSRLDSSARYWVVATLIGGAIHLAPIFGDDLPPLWSHSIPIALGGASAVLMGLGLARLYKPGPQRRSLLGLGAGTLVLIAVMEWARVETDPQVTWLLAGGLGGLTSLWGAYFAHTLYQRSGNPFAMHMRWVMVSLGLLHVLYMQGEVFGWGVNTLGQEAWTYSIWTGTLVLGMLRYFAYMAIRIQEQADKQRQTLTALAREEEGRRLSARLAHQDRQYGLGVMSASFAHELNQPLTAILNYAEHLQHQLKNGHLDPATSSSVLDDIVANSVRAGEIIHRIRHFIQPAALKKELVDLRGVIHEVCSMVEPVALRNDIEIIKPPLTQQPIWVLGDSVQLSQVLFNVLRNAIESVAKVQERRVQLDIRQDHRDILMEIHDSGPGLSEAAAEQAGDPFYTTKISGLGMGLSISKTILAQFDGRLSLENTGRGACARITLPMVNVA